MAKQIIFSYIHLKDDTGQPLRDGYAQFFRAGTDVHVPTYSSKETTSQNINPDSLPIATNGYIGPIFFDANFTHDIKINVHNPIGNLIAQFDNQVLISQVAEDDDDGIDGDARGDIDSLEVRATNLEDTKLDTTTYNNLASRVTTNEQDIENLQDGTDIEDNVILTRHVLDLNITGDKIATSAISDDKLAERAVTEPKMGNLSVGTRALIERAVTGEKIALGVVPAHSGQFPSGFTAGGTHSIDTVVTNGFYAIEHGWGGPSGYPAAEINGWLRVQTWPDGLSCTQDYFPDETSMAAYLATPQIDNVIHSANANVYVQNLKQWRRNGTTDVAGTAITWGGWFPVDGYAWFDNNTLTTGHRSLSHNLGAIPKMLDFYARIIGTGYQGHTAGTITQLNLGPDAHGTVSTDRTGGPARRADLESSNTVRWQVQTYYIIHANGNAGSVSGANFSSQARLMIRALY